jgi:kynurenine formamidase
MAGLSRSVLPDDDIDTLAERVKNWGRWGPDDQLGTLNYITPEKIASAAQLVRSGTIFELGVPLDRDGPQVNAPRRFNPVHMMTAIPDMDPRSGGAGIADDVLVLPLQASTQWDSLAHVTYKGRMYGGQPTSRVTTRGAEVNSIRAISGRVMTRGVLIDLARYAGMSSLEAGYAISVADLEGALAATGATLETGDALLIRTGYLGDRRADSWRGYIGDTPGLGLDTVEWIHRHELAAVATDTVAVEVKPSQIAGFLVPFHVLAIAHMGLLMGEIFDLEALAQHCHEDGIFEFLFVAPPLPVTGGVGSPINPYAVK